MDAERWRRVEEYRAFMPEFLARIPTVRLATGYSLNIVCYKLAYSALACLSTGRSGSASFQSVKTSR